MRELKFLEGEDDISKYVFDTIFRGPYSEPLCPRILKLSWTVDAVFGSDFAPFLSPQLRDVHLESRPGTRFPFPHVISALPISSLKSLHLSVIGDEPVREAITSMFETYSKSLMTLEVSRMDQLRDVSWSRIMALPHLRVLKTDQWPPTTFPSNLPALFPSLRNISLHGPLASGWIHFLAEGSAQGVSHGTGSKPRIVAPHLVQLYCDYGVELGGTLASCLGVFRSLSSLVLGGSSPCSRRPCAFRLTDEDVSRLAIELPGLRKLFLGVPCAYGTCRTTVNSLLALSVYCKGLHELCIHFNTRNFAWDMKNSLRNPLRRIPHPPSRCPLAVLDVGLTPLTAEALGKDVFPTLAGLVDIFPRLQKISHTTSGWRRLNAQIPSFQEMRRSLPAVFAQ